MIRTLQPPRHLAAEERALMDLLVSARFPGNVELAEQIPHLLVSAACSNCPTIELIATDVIPTSKVVQRVPVEARGGDVDGVPVHILLHVVNGVAAEVEVYREDGQGIREMPALATLEVTTARG